MRIVHILASLGSGGIQGFVFSLASEQANSGNIVYVIVTDICNNAHADIQEKVLLSKGVTVYRLNRIVGNKYELIKSLCRCRFLVKKLNPDIINSHASFWHLYGAFSSIGTKYKHICTIHNTPEKWNMLVSLFCKDKAIICCSNEAYHKRVQTNSKAICIENGVDENLVRTNQVVDLRKIFNLSDNSKIVISVGNLRPQKNYKFLKQLSEQFEGTNIHFFICGGNLGGPAYEDPQLYEGCKNLHCLGVRSDISAIENCADLFLSSSTFEGLPIAVLEAYFNGIPCVLSPIPQHESIANVDYVWIPKSFDLDDFIIAIKDALKCTESHDSIYKQRQSQIERFSIKRTAKEYLDFYVSN